MNPRENARLDYGIWNPTAGGEPVQPTPVLDVAALVLGYALTLAPLVSIFFS